MFFSIAFSLQQNANEHHRAQFNHFFTFCGIILEIRRPGQKALQTTIKPTLFVDFCLIPLSNTCSFVHCHEGFCVGKFGHVVDQVVLDNRPLRKHFRRSRLCYKRQALLMKNN